MSGLQIAGYLFPLLTVPYLARVIGVDGYGKIAFATAIVSWVQTTVDWGFGYTATRDVARSRDDKEHVSQIFSNVLWARVVLMVLAFAILGVVLLAIPAFRANAAIILVTFLLVPGHILFPDWFFQAVERMKYVTLLNLLMKFIFTVAVFVFVREREDYIIQPLLNACGYAVCGVIALYLIVGKWKVHLHRPHIASIRQTIKRSTDVFVNNLAPNLFHSFSIMLLGVFGGSAATGVFDGGDKFSTICTRLQSILSQAFFPFLARRGDKHGTFAMLAVGLAVAMCAALFIFAPLIVDMMLTEEFADSAIVMRILAVSLIFFALNNVYGTNYLILHNREKTIRNVTLAGSLIGFGVSLPLVYHFGYVGAALTITTGRAVLGLGAFIAARRHKHGLSRG